MCYYFQITPIVCMFEFRESYIAAKSYSLYVSDAKTISKWARFLKLTEKKTQLMNNTIDYIQH